MTFDEQCRRFVGIGRGFGFGFGSGFGRDSGRDSGRGRDSGYGNVCGIDSVSGSGRGSGWDSGNGRGSASGFGFGEGNGSASGRRQLSWLRSVGGQKVYRIDTLPTILVRIRGDFAKGYILRDDLTLEPCWIVKGGGKFAHGATLRAAWDDLLEKLFDDMPEDERIQAFVDAHEGGRAYPNSDFFWWHHKLTGSCEMGRREFAAAHEIDIDHGTMTVQEFIALTRHAYGGSIIQKLEVYYDV